MLTWRHLLIYILIAVLVVVAWSLCLDYMNNRILQVVFQASQSLVELLWEAIETRDSSGLKIKVRDSESSLAFCSKGANLLSTPQPTIKAPFR